MFTVYLIVYSFYGISLYENYNRFFSPSFWEEFRLETGNYIILTLHRPSNVDEEKSLINLLEGIDQMVGRKKIIFPILIIK
jgi:UDP-N-acetylglucosamine 2-epimerase (non-hydrolysing)